MIAHKQNNPSPIPPIDKIKFLYYNFVVHLSYVTTVFIITYTYKMKIKALRSLSAVNKLNFLVNANTKYQYCIF